MATVEPTIETLADLLARIGDVPPERIQFHPPPGTATEKDVLRAAGLPRKRLCELVEGVLVEKAVGVDESIIAGILIQRLLNHLDQNKTGFVLAPDGPVRLVEGLVRLPDVSFVSLDRLPGRKRPKDKILRVAPDLAIEVLSQSNTRKEIRRKIQDYFTHGVRLVWIIDPRKETAEAYHSPTDVTKIGKSRSLEGEDVLPGFSVSLSELFSD